MKNFFVVVVSVVLAFCFYSIGRFYPIFPTPEPTVVYAQSCGWAYELQHAVEENEMADADLRMRIEKLERRSGIHGAQTELHERGR